MHYDKAMLKSWAEMPTWGQHLERHGGLSKYSSKEGFTYLQREYFDQVEKRISCCKELLKDYQDTFLYYVIAELYDRADLNRSLAYLYKRYTRFFASKALKLDPSYIPAKELLDRAGEWVEFLGGDKDYMPEIEIQFKNVEENEKFENTA